jgi:hypothetical protein
VGKGFLCGTAEPHWEHALVNVRVLCMASSYLSYANSLEIFLAPFFQDLKQETCVHRIVTEGIKAKILRLIRPPSQRKLPPAFRSHHPVKANVYLAGRIHLPEDNRDKKCVLQRLKVRCRE